MDRLSHSLLLLAEPPPRQSSTRITKLNLQRERLDWFVPVVYSSGVDMLFVDPGCNVLSNQLDSGGSEQEPSTETTFPIINIESWMNSRHIDLLRLEKLLLQLGKAYLPAWTTRRWGDCFPEICRIYLGRNKLCPGRGLRRLRSERDIFRRGVCEHYFETIVGAVRRECNVALLDEQNPLLSVL